MKAYKLAILMSHPIQYHVPLFRALSERPDVELMVYFFWDFGVTAQRDPEFGTVVKWDIPMLEGYRHTFLRNLSPRPGPSFFGEINPSIVGELRRNRYDAVLVYGYSHLTTWFAFLGARLSRTPIMLRGITHLLDERPGLVRFVKHVILPPLFRAASLVLYIGRHNQAFYRAYGVPDGKMLHTPHVVSNEFFRAHDEALRPRRGEIRREFGISDDDPVILFPGKLVPWKNPLLLLEAYERLRARHRCHLLFVGEGLQRQELERTVSDRSIPGVLFTGFLNQTEMPRAYVAADVLCLPSKATETWGLVVNEGMNFGLPAVVSDRVGCATDLVLHGENGYVIDSPESLERALEDLVTSPDRRAAFGRRSRELIARWGVPECVEAIVAGVRRVKGTN